MSIWYRQMEEALIENKALEQRLSSLATEHNDLYRQLSNERNDWNRTRLDLEEKVKTLKSELARTKEMKATADGFNDYYCGSPQAHNDDFAQRVKDMVAVNDKLRHASATMRQQLQRRDRKVEKLCRQLLEENSRYHNRSGEMAHQLLESQETRVRALEQDAQLRQEIFSSKDSKLANLEKQRDELLLCLERANTNEQSTVRLQEESIAALKARQRDLKEQRERAATLEKELDGQSEKMRAISAQHNKLQVESEALSRHIQDLTMELAESIELETQLRQEVENSQETISSLESENNDTKLHCSILRNELDTTKKEHTTERMSWVREIDKAAVLHSDLSKRLANAEHDIEQYRIFVLQVKEEVQTLTTETVRSDHSPLDETGSLAVPTFCLRSD